MDDLENEIKALDTQIDRISEEIIKLERQIIFDKISLRTENLLFYGLMEENIE